MLDSIYHMTLILLKNCILGGKNIKILPLSHNVILEVIT